MGRSPCTNIGPMSGGMGHSDTNVHATMLESSFDMGCLLSICCGEMMVSSHDLGVDVLPIPVIVMRSMPSIEVGVEVGCSIALLRTGLIGCARRGLAGDRLWEGSRTVTRRRPQELRVVVQRPAVAGGVLGSEPGQVDHDAFMAVVGAGGLQAPARAGGRVSYHHERTSRAASRSRQRCHGGRPTGRRERPTRPRLPWVLPVAPVTDAATLRRVAGANPAPPQAGVPHVPDVVPQVS